MSAFVIVWAASCAVGYFIGRDKGDATTGALLGLLGGPIGVILAALFMRSADERRQHEERHQAIGDDHARQAWKADWKANRRRRRARSK